MPKYYISDSISRAIVDSTDPFNACVDMIIGHKVNSVITGPGAAYFVSEQGFMWRDTDLAISADAVLSEVLKRLET